MTKTYALSVTKPILCIGCLSVDLIETCDRMPEVGGKSSSLDAYWQRGGHAGNVSWVLKILGAQVEFLGMLSQSSMMREIKLEMERRCIDLSHCPKTEKSPPFSTIVTAQKTGCRTILHSRRNFPYVTWEDFQKLDLSLYGWVHFEARNKLNTIRMIRAILDYNNGRTDRIQISLKVDSFYKENRDMFDMCDYVIFSRQLALDLGWQTPQETCEQLDQNLSLPRTIDMRRPCMICSWGEQGAGCLDNQGRYFELPANIKGKPRDTYGVGECFTAGVLYALYVRKMTLAGAVAFGNRVAGHKVTRVGYDHISTLNIYPVTLTADPDHRQDQVSEDEESEHFMFKKFFNRPIEYSNGKLSTSLLQRFEPADYVHVDADPSDDSEPDLQTQPVETTILPSAIIKMPGFRLSDDNRKNVHINTMKTANEFVN